MADITITVDGTTGEPSVTDSRLIPLVTHYDYNRNEYTVYPLDRYTEELAARHSVHRETEDVFTLESLKQSYQEVLSREYHTLEGQ